MGRILRFGSWWGRLPCLVVAFLLGAFGAYMEEQERRKMVGFLLSFLLLLFLVSWFSWGYLFAVVGVLSSEGLSTKVTITKAAIPVGTAVYMPLFILSVES